MLILIEIVFDVSWLLKEQPAVEHSYSRRSANVRICRGSENGSYVIGLFYPFLLTGKYNNILVFNATKNSWIPKLKKKDKMILKESQEKCFKLKFVLKNVSISLVKLTHCLVFF